MNISSLPPKMTLQFAERAKRGDYDNYVGSNIYQFFQGNQIVTLIGLKHPTGHIKKVSTTDGDEESIDMRCTRNKDRCCPDDETCCQITNPLTQEG